MNRAAKRIIVADIFFAVTAILVILMMLSVGVDYDVVINEEKIEYMNSVLGREYSMEAAKYHKWQLDMMGSEENPFGNNATVEGIAPYEEPLPMLSMEEDTLFGNISGMWNSSGIFWKSYMQHINNAGRSNVISMIATLFLWAACFFLPILTILCLVIASIMIIIVLIEAIAFAVVPKKKLSKSDKKELERSTFDPLSPRSFLWLWMLPLESLIGYWLVELCFNIKLATTYDLWFTNIPVSIKLSATTPLNHLAVFAIGLIVLLVGRAVINKIYGKPQEKEEKQEAQSAEK